jgi:HEPN domain-containing protein
VADVSPPERDPLAWLAKAEEDLAAVDLLVAAIPTQAAYHLQQAVEKLLKAVIVQVGQRPPHIHSLVTLRDLVGQEIEWDAGPEWLARVSDWVATTRYPVGALIWSAPTTAIVEDARVEALSLLTEVKSRLAS